MGHSNRLFVRGFHNTLFFFGPLILVERPIFYSLGDPFVFDQRSTSLKINIFFLITKSALTPVIHEQYPQFTKKCNIELKKYFFLNCALNQHDNIQSTITVIFGYVMTHWHNKRSAHVPWPTRECDLNSNLAA